MRLIIFLFSSYFLYVAGYSQQGPSPKVINAVATEFASNAYGYVTGVVSDAMNNVDGSN